MIFRYLLLVSSAVSFTHAQPPGYTIAGTVVQHGSNAPVRHAHISITPYGDRTGQTAAVTGNAGEFSFTGLRAGKYVLAVATPGGPHLYLQNEGFSTGIVAGPNQDSQHLVFALETPAAIKGTVLDEEGDPASQVTVMLFRRGVFAGRARTFIQSRAQADAEGRFRFRDLAPGTYFLGAQGRPWFAQYMTQAPGSRQAASRAALDVVFPFTYYPGVTNFAAATPLSLAEGATAEAQIALRAVPALHIGIAGLPSESDQFTPPQLFQVGPGGAALPFISGQTFQGNGRYEIESVAPGDYFLIVDNARHGTPEMVGGKSVSLVADVSVDVSELRRTTVLGQALFAGGELSGLSIGFDDIANGVEANAPIRSDGSFRVDQLNPGRYELTLPNGAGLYLKTIAVKGGAYSRGELDVPEGANIHLSIELAKGFSSLDGVVVKDGKPFPGAMVLLLPLDFVHGSDTPRDQSDSDGTFNFAQVPPGRYALLAVDNGRDFAYRDPAVIAPYLQQASQRDVPARVHEHIQLEVVHRQQ